MKHNKTPGQPSLKLLAQKWRNKPMSPAEMLNICIAERIALETLRLGQGVEADWVVVRDVAIVAETMAFNGIVPEAQLDASDALLVLADVYATMRRPTAQELKTLDRTLAYHDSQRERVSRGRLFEMLKKAEVRFNEASK